MKFSDCKIGAPVRMPNGKIGHIIGFTEVDGDNCIVIRSIRYSDLLHFSCDSEIIYNHTILPLTQISS